MTLETYDISNAPRPIQFSAVSPNSLSEDEYTLVNIIDDVSPSTTAFRKEACEMKKMIVEACKKSPRAAKLMIRFVIFGSAVKEVYGYKPLSEINPNDFQPESSIGGSTALFDAAVDGIVSSAAYAEKLDLQADIMSNGIIFIITDGEDNASRCRITDVSNEIKSINQKETMESLKVILIGLNTSGGTSSYLDKFYQDANLDQYIDAGDATPQKLAKLADFVSKSISSQSQSLGSGGASQNLTF